MSELKVNTISNAAGTNAISIDGSGNVTLAQNLAATTMSGDLTLDSNGIYLGGTGAANYLDDYEEGTWTPTLTFGGASVGLTYGGQDGKYIKIGNKVFLQANFSLTNKGSSTGHAWINGLPFANTSPAVGMMQGDNLTFGTGYLIYYSANGWTYLHTYLQGSGTPGTSAFTDTGFANNTNVRITFSYITS